MTKKHYVANDDLGKVEQLEYFAEHIPEHAEKLGLTPAMVASIKADAKALRYSVTITRQAQAKAHECVEAKNTLRDGGDGDGAFPSATISDQPPPDPVEPGIIPRFNATVTYIKSSSGYTEAIGKYLKIVGSERLLDPSTWQPQLTLRQDARHPIVVWPKGDADSLELWVAREPQGVFVLLEVTTNPHYADPTPLPAAPTIWIYKAIYRLRDAQVGNWSNPVSTLVGG